MASEISSFKAELDVKRRKAERNAFDQKELAETTQRNVVLETEN